MIISVHEAIRDSVTEVFSDWTEDDRLLGWDHHIGVGLFHKNECPDDECCPLNCAGSTPTCCCDHALGEAVTIHLMLSTDGTPQNTKHWTQVMLMPFIFTPALDSLLRDVRLSYEARQQVHEVDVDTLIEDILSSGADTRRPDSDTEG